MVAAHQTATGRLQVAVQSLAVPRNPKKFEMAKELGATDCVNPKDYDKPIQQVSKWPN